MAYIKRVNLDRLRSENELRIAGWERADCGYCGLTPPDEFGQRELEANPRCPFHGEGE